MTWLVHFVASLAIVTLIRFGLPYAFEPWLAKRERKRLWRESRGDAPLRGLATHIPVESALHAQVGQQVFGDWVPDDTHIVAIVSGHCICLDKAIPVDSVWDLFVVGDDPCVIKVMH